MKLSVMITFYNQSQYVDQALESVIGQEVDFEYEILIGDDGSDDGTWEKLNSWQARHPDKIKLFRQPRAPEERHPDTLMARRRGTANRLNLLKKAQGQYLVILDGDDYYTSSKKYQIQADILDDPANADCVGCGHAVDKTWADGRVVHTNNPAMREQKFVAERYWAVMYFSSVGLMYRNHFREYIPEEMFLRFWLAEESICSWLLQFGGLYYLPQVMAHHRQHSQSNMNRLTELEKSLSVLSVYDFGELVEPKFAGARAHRYRHCFAAIYKHRNELSDPRYDRFRWESQRQKSRTALLWLNYGRNWRTKLKGHVFYWQQKLRATWFHFRHPQYFKPGGLQQTDK